MASAEKHSVQAQNRKIEHLRGSLIAIERAMGVSIKDLAAKYSCSPGAVKRYLDQAAQTGLVEHFRALLFERLMGKALAVYEARIELGDLEAARDMVFGLGVLQKNPQTDKPQKVIDSLAEYRALKAKKDDDAS